jgi:hypothetical protein
MVIPIQCRNINGTSSRRWICFNAVGRTVSGMHSLLACQVSPFPNVVRNLATFLSCQAMDRLTDASVLFMRKGPMSR